MTPLVSVIVPTYNSERFILQTVKSIKDQTFKDFEILVIDDGSTDRTVELLQKFKQIKLIKQKNYGPSRARNIGIKASKGLYCAFLDSDDLMIKERLELQCKALEKDDKVGLVYSDLKTFNDNGIVHNSKKEFMRLYSGYILNFLLLENFITTSTVMVRRKCFDVVGLFDEQIKLSEDYKMWLNIAKRYLVEYIDIPLVLYRYHIESLSSNRIKINKSSYKIVMDYWENNEKLKKNNPKLYNLSMQKQLIKLGESYRIYGKKINAIKFILYALKFNIMSKEALIILLKIFLQKSIGNYKI